MSRLNTAKYLGLTGILTAMPVLSMAYFDSDKLDQRLSKLEHIVNNTQSLEQIERIQSMQDEIQTLRGQLEEATMAIQQLKKEQHAFYQDLDLRLNKEKTQTKEEHHATYTAPFDAVTTQPVTAQVPVVEVKPITQPLVESEDVVYQRAYSLIASKQYDLAIPALKEYMSRFPEGKLMPNAYYWLGEIYLHQKKLDEALEAFMSVVNKYPASQKHGDAILKMGYVYDAQGNLGDAKRLYQQVSSSFKGSTIARLADAQLARMNLGSDL